MAFANLHTHTLFSDGRTNPHDLVKAVFNEEGLEIFSLTDHDTMSGIEPLFRYKRAHESQFDSKGKKFIPGIEITLMEEKSELTVHLLGLFPNVDDRNLEEALERIDSILGDYCLFRCKIRGERDLDARVRYAFDINLDGIADRYGSAESVIRILRDRAAAESRAIFERFGKESDIIQHPVPVTYQAMIDHWEALLPSSNAEKVALYIYRPDREKQKQLSQIYLSEGMAEPEAIALAEKNQSQLYTFKRPPAKDKNLFEGLELLQRARAITFLAHPAADHQRIGYEDFDNLVLFPLLDRGLDGIEVFYPYDMSYRNEAAEHYGRIARDRGLLMTGGTDYHGDGRVGLDEVKLDIREAERIIHYNKKE